MAGPSMPNTSGPSARPTPLCGLKFGMIGAATASPLRIKQKQRLACKHAALFLFDSIVNRGLVSSVIDQFILIAPAVEGTDLGTDLL